MIRIVRAREGLGFEEAARTPDACVWSGLRTELARELAAGFGAKLGPDEVDAVKRAAGTLGAAEAVDIVIAAGGAIFRVLRRATPVEALPEPPVATDTPVFTRNAGARIVYIGNEDEPSERICDGLRFLGYEARLVPHREVGVVLATLRAFSPQVAIVPRARFAVLGRELVAHAQAEGNLGLVLLAPRGSAMPMPEVEAMIEVPFLLESVPRVIDPVIEGVERARSAGTPAQA